MKVPPKRMIVPLGKRMASQQFRDETYLARPADPEKAQAPIKRDPENGPGTRRDRTTPPTD